MYAASTANAMMRGRSRVNAFVPPPTPSTDSTALMPTSCSAMYGIVATIPVMAIAVESSLLPYRPPTKSAGVT